MGLDDREARLLRLAEAIADRTPVDWEQASRIDPESSDSLDALRALEAVVSAHGPIPDTLKDSIGATWGPLQIRAKIGEGAFGEVYRAYDPGLEREVALKLLHPARSKSERATRRFIEEARRLAKVRHPNVLVVHGADVHDGRAGMWTDLVRGRTLEESLTQDGPWSAHEAALVGIDLCRALAAVHAAGLIHRDVKTQNVMREEGGRTVLMDFGSVGVSSPDGGPAPGDGAYGTPLTVAPEVLRGDPARPSTDVYSLGVLLYRLVSKRYPIEASTMSELTEKHARRAAIPLREARPDLPTDFVQAVERATDPDPARRLDGPGSLERALVACFAGHGEVRAQVAVTRRRLRRPAAWLAAAAALALAVVAVVLVTKPPARKLPVAKSPESVSLAAAAWLYREAGGKSEPLMPGGRIAPGDELYLELESDEAVNVYVLDEDEAGSVYVLFPLPGLDAVNPLPPNTKHRLPGSRQGKPENWEVTSAGGSEDVLVIASRTPLPAIERALANVPRAQPGAPVLPAELSREGIETMRGIGAPATTRGIGGTTAPDAPPPADPSARLSDIWKALARQPGVARDVWVWQTRLSNPPGQR